MQLKTLHSTSVVIEDAGVIIIGNSGSGKSDLALRLIDSGATLISDDVTLLKKNEESIFLFPPLETKGLLEVREIGIMTVPYIDNIKLMLIVELVEKEVERLPKKKFSKLMNLNIPKIKIYGKNSSSVAKIKLKLNEIKNNA
ncbi:MAG: HPr kinase/phosphatase C-terminal domain-containing protein [Pseudomonadota bacterium]|nr:HPr kinase/phosphatase C-terminal domain-containing protein [Pseudomonadota bacterium]